MNAPIKYFGGKGTMFNKILEFFPDETQFDTYIEPFGGSYSIGFKKKPSKIEIYNDLEQNVYSLYKVLSDKDLFPLFKEKCDMSLYSEDLRIEYKELLKTNLSILNRAFYFFYVNRTSFNGVGGLATTSIVRRNMSKSISDFLSSIDNLYEIHQRLSTVLILNRDALELIEKYNTKNVFMYLDPPYEQSTRTNARYVIDMDEEKQKQFINTVINKNSKIMISGYDCELYQKLNDNGFTQHKFEVSTMGGDFKPKSKTESIWINY